VAEWYSAGQSRVRIPPVAAVYQHQLSMPSLRGRLMSTSKSWGVNGHTTRCTSPVSAVLQLRLVSGWGLWNEDSAASWALRLGKGLYFLADRTSTVALLVRCCVCRLSVTLCIVAKRCILEQKLLLRAYRKSYIRNRLVPKWMTLTFV